jgi:hypothetical protein
MKVLPTAFEIGDCHLKIGRYGVPVTR